jgi:pantoate--beta-alanine ligase
MQVTGHIPELRDIIRGYKKEGKKVSFVPTMGALHDGHLSLIRLAKKHSDVVVVSIYVNPKQFAPNEDFASYPSTLKQDLNFCDQEGVSLIFTPDTEVMYNQELFFSIDIHTLNEYLDGASRQGYFQGIALVVNKLFNIVEPDVAIFGQKDYQQYKVIEALVEEFNHGIELLMAPIERAPDGLALSSRNAYLTPAQREVAPLLYQCLLSAKVQIEQGMKDWATMFLHLQQELLEAGFRNDYFGIFDTEKLHPVDKIVEGQRYLIAVAAYLDKARLIDNVIFTNKTLIKGES